MPSGVAPGLGNGQVPGVGRGCNVTTQHNSNNFNHNQAMESALRAQAHLGQGVLGTMGSPESIYSMLVAGSVVNI